MRDETRAQKRCIQRQGESIYLYCTVYTFIDRAQCIWTIQNYVSHLGIGVDGLNRNFVFFPLSLPVYTFHLFFSYFSLFSNFGCVFCFVDKKRNCWLCKPWISLQNEQYLSSKSIIDFYPYSLLITLWIKAAIADCNRAGFLFLV